jgi:hypothetical protein
MWGIPVAQIIAKRFDTLINERNMPVFLALSLPNSEDFVIKIHILNVQVGKLT